MWVAARERVAALAAKSPKFSAIDRVIGRNGLKVVPAPLLTLLLLCLRAYACVCHMCLLVDLIIDHCMQLQLLSGCVSSMRRLPCCCLDLQAPVSMPASSGLWQFVAFELHHCVLL